MATVQVNDLDIEKLQFTQNPKEIEETISFVKKGDFKEIDLEWDQLNITATVTITKRSDGKTIKVKETKPILNNLAGSVKHGEFTAIMGPSGSGKTTLLNFLSGRITGDNLNISGNLKVNSQPVNDIDDIGNLVAYVMQDDILLATSTPREALTFAADLRLKLPRAEKTRRVEGLLKDLGLLHCANTKIGNVLIRGVSGGERKRTSIGVELITNPSMLFLDEPTTGLDSTTSLKLLELLKALARSGRTIVCTIHQPNSEIYSHFGNLMLLVRGYIIYQGKASEAVEYFANIGFPCPRFSNPADYFMKIMNETGFIIDDLKNNAESMQEMSIEVTEESVEAKFQERVNLMVESYQRSPMVSECKRGILTTKVENSQLFMVSWLIQLYLILKRTLIFEIRNPLDFQMKTVQVVIFALVEMAIFYNLGTGQNGVQNRNGVLFFMSTVVGFGSINGSVLTFSMERPVYVRERLSKSYTTSAYFWGKVAAEMPFLILYPTIFVSLIYYVIGLQPSGDKFFVCWAIHVVGWIAGAAYGTCISTFVPNVELAMSLVPVLVVPFLLFAGYFVNQHNIPYFLYEIEYISIFKYVYQALNQNEFQGLNLPGCNPPQCDPLALSNFTEGIGLSIGLMGAMAVGWRIVGYLGLKLISNPKKPKILRPKITN